MQNILVCYIGILLNLSTYYLDIDEACGFSGDPNDLSTESEFFFFFLKDNLQSISFSLLAVLSLYWYLPASMLGICCILSDLSHIILLRIHYRLTSSHLLIMKNLVLV